MGFNSKPSVKRTQPSTVFGHIPGVPIGSTFENRLFLHHSSVHSGILAGIAGSKDEGCYSVVLSGGYEDDKDEGYKFTYTGCGGRDRKDGEKPREGPQTCDQSWKNSRNQSLRVSSYTKKPVRVVRGYKSRSDFAPVEGYRYDGLYIVERAWMDVGKSGFQVCKYSLKRLPDQPPIPRRQGTLNLDLSQWEEPRHFGKDEDDSDSSTISEKRMPKNGKRKPVPLTHTGGSDDGDSPMEGPSSSRPKSPARKLPPLKLPTPAVIPPTTNVTPVERKPAVALPQSASRAPQPDVHALLAEWAGHGSKLGISTSPPPPAQKVAATQRPCPVRTFSNSQPPTMPTSSYGASLSRKPQAILQPRTSNTGAGTIREATRVKVEDMPRADTHTVTSVAITRSGKSAQDSLHTDMNMDWDDEMHL
ncbi:PUA-like domain-containing protein [Trametes gibbosa]|nr:PUA-like domain-containing protein [Trametes gibbosa]